jgi:hypothetical protein
MIELLKIDHDQNETFTGFTSPCLPQKLLWLANKQQKGGDKAKRCLFVQSLLNHLCQCLSTGGNGWKIKRQKEKVYIRQVYHLVAICGNHLGHVYTYTILYIPIHSYTIIP